MNRDLNTVTDSTPAAYQDIDMPTRGPHVCEPSHVTSRIIPKVRKCGVTHFKNRFSPNESLYVVDVLEAEIPEIGPQMQEELKLRQNLPRKRTKDKGKAGSVKLGTQKKPGPATTQGFHFGHSGRMFILRIRIQSPAILQILSRLLSSSSEDEEAWDTKPRTFCRPFGSLIFHHPRVCEYLTRLQERWGSSANQDTLEPPQSRARTPSSMAESVSELFDGPAAKLAVDDCPAALAELSCYVKFMNEEVMGFYHKFDHLSSESAVPPKVRFQDLWYLFRVGELIYRPVGTGSNKEMGNTSLGSRTWRCYGMRPVWTNQAVSRAENRGISEYEDSERSSFGVHCYYIDYTGDEFCVVTETFEIPPFKGERLIRSLKVYPYRFAGTDGTDHRELLRSAIDNGRKFLQSTKSRHVAYNGWTTTVTPKGGPTTDVEGNELKRPEFIDSEVIVDFVEAFQTCPAWKPEAVVVKPEEPNPHQAEDDFTICWWSDKDRSKLLQETTEVVVLHTGITTFERNDNLNPDIPSADRFLIKIRENDRNGKPTTEAHLCQDEGDTSCDLALLPSRVFAYVLRDRKFAQLLVQRVSPVKKSSDAFEYLNIDPRHKSMIQSLVEEHFERKLSDRERGVDLSSIDLIRGKGKGLFILLHGVPGVGKTATAEAIAAANGKPLFPITCGDLGLTPTAVEAALLRIFRLADAWNCVLLLDEVDTFFSQRARGDATLEKNALVSVFLRVLEYYDGLLFLTTNRPGALDEAFKSRIHLKLYYPNLTFDQTKEIWRMNIDRLERIEQERFSKSQRALTQPLHVMRKRILRFADEMFKSQKGTHWNGRQIRNAFQVASSLAHYDARKDDCAPKLTVEHFKTIFSVTEDFDQFMTETHGGRTAGEQAYERGDRADHYVGLKPSQVDDKSGESFSEDLLTGREYLRRRQTTNHFNNRRSRSPNLAATTYGGGRSAGGDGGIFGSGSRGITAPQAPPSPRERPQFGGRNPGIEVTTSGGGSRDFLRRDSDRSEPEKYLTPTAATNKQWGRDASGSGRDGGHGGRGSMKRGPESNPYEQQEWPWERAGKRRRSDDEDKEDEEVEEQ